MVRKTSATGFVIAGWSASTSFTHTSAYVFTRSGNLAVADMTTTAIPGSPGYGVPNGLLNNDGFFQYLAVFRGRVLMQLLRDLQRFHGCLGQLRMA